MARATLVSGSKDEHYHLHRWCWCLADEWPLCCGVVHHYLAPSSQRALPRRRCAMTDGLQQFGWRGYSVDGVPRSSPRCLRSICSAPSSRFLLSPLAGRARRRPLWERCESCGSASAINHLTAVEWANTAFIIKVGQVSDDEELGSLATSLRIYLSITSSGLKWWKNFSLNSHNNDEDFLSFCFGFAHESMAYCLVCLFIKKIVWNLQPLTFLKWPFYIRT